MEMASGYPLLSMDVCIIACDFTPIDYQGFYKTLFEDQKTPKRSMVVQSLFSPLTGPKDKNAKKLKIPATITVDGKTYKVTAIKDNAFKGMKKLTSVEIGKNIKTIGKNAFSKCSKLKTITIKTTNLTKDSVKSGAFKGIDKKATIKCPKKKKKEYQKFLVKKGVPKTAKFK